MRKFWRKRTEFEAAQAQARASGGVTCGTYKPDGTPAYFVMASDASPDQIANLAFFARYDRPPNDSDVVLADLVKRAHNG